MTIDGSALRARVLARCIVVDLAMYRGDVSEARAVFESRVEPEHHGALDGPLTLLPFRIAIQSTREEEWPQLSIEGEARELAAWIADDILVLDDPARFAAEVALWEARFRRSVALAFHAVFGEAVAFLLSDPPPVSPLTIGLGIPRALP
jgi:hypothetical protein